MSMPESPDRLYDLLPPYLRTSDFEVGSPLRDLVRIVAGQVGDLEQDIDQLYANWFIETCQDWVVPYIAELVGYRLENAAGPPSEAVTREGRLLNKVLISRREVGNTIHDRRRKGTLALLDSIAAMVSAWPATVVESYTRVATNQHVNHIHLDRGRLVDVRNRSALAKIDGPFDDESHTVDVRRPNSAHSKGYYNITDLVLNVWRLSSYPITRSPAYHLEHNRASAGLSGKSSAQGGHEAPPNPFRYTFSILGDDEQLYIQPVEISDPAALISERNVPTPLRRQALLDDLAEYYGPGKSLEIYRGDLASPVAIDEIVVADLTGWKYQPTGEHIAVDPELGRIALASQAHGSHRLWVSYHYGAAARWAGVAILEACVHLKVRSIASAKREVSITSRSGRRLPTGMPIRLTRL